MMMGNGGGVNDDDNDDDDDDDEGMVGKSLDLGQAWIFKEAVTGTDRSSVSS